MVLYSLIVHLMVLHMWLFVKMYTLLTMRGWFTESERATIVHNYPPPLPTHELCT